MSLEEWNERYRTTSIPGEPLPFVVEWASRLKPGKVLDVACGRGRHSLWLARQGWKVTAIDGAPAAIDNLRGIPGLEVHRLDLESHALELPGGPYDLVIETCFLHRPLFAAIEKVTAPGGMLLFVQKTEGRFAIDCAELRRTFATWQVLHCAAVEKSRTLEFAATNGVEPTKSSIRAI